VDKGWGESREATRGQMEGMNHHTECRRLSALSERLVSWDTYVFRTVESKIHHAEVAIIRWKNVQKEEMNMKEAEKFVEEMKCHIQC
jgi:hypothetical protein